MIFKKIIPHIPFILFSYFFAGIIIGGFLAPQERINLLNSAIISSGTYISFIGALLYVPVLIIYLIRNKN